MRVGSLFSGIGGLDLGLQRAGMEIVWQVEVDEWCRRVLARHFPDAVRYGDVRACHGETVADAKPVGSSRATTAEQQANADPVAGCCSLAPVDLICGGFPCQPVSHAGRRLGAADDRWLWSEFLRIIREVRPRWALVENVPGLLSIDDGRLFGGILRDLAESGYAAEWDCIPAAAVGAPHIRDRVFIVAHAPGVQPRAGQQPAGDHEAGYRGAGGVANTLSQGFPILQGGQAGTELARLGASCGAGWWATEPDVGRVAHGVPARVDRLRGLGNAVVPQVAEYIGRRIMEAEDARPR